MRKQDKADDNASHHVADDYLQEREIGVVSQAGNADDRQRASFGGDDGKRDGPPWDVASREEVVAQSALLLAKAETEQRDADQVERDDRVVEIVEPHQSSQTRSNYFNH